MNDKRLNRIIAAYGADCARWPADERVAALARLARGAPPILEQERRLDAHLARLPAPRPQAGLAARIVARAGALAQHRPLRALLGDTWHWLLPQAVGLAAAAVAGFLVAQAGQPSGLMDTAELVLRLDAGVPALEDWSL
ncbi:MAG: hypothetical protein D6782_09780 [Alphaproteobacteria bacterium]|nr:MAG: hypothetical protein D6782_09780 [Alphaproteobacteria bacterium]